MNSNLSSPSHSHSNTTATQRMLLQPYSIDKSILLSRLSKRRRELSPEEAFEIVHSGKIIEKIDFDTC